ncbi:MAG TPA: sugar ABC transporter permease [Clostridia bacterium]|nr:sugar ABC transporter permease [Clostridia bacterium]
MGIQSSSLEKRRLRSTRIAATVFLFPALIILLIFIAYPIVDSFRISAFEWNGISSVKKFVGLGNWKTLSTDMAFWRAFTNNIIIMALSLLIQLPIAMALATFLDIGGKKLNIFKVVYFLPLLMSSVAVGFLFKYALSSTNGILTGISKAFGGGMVDVLGSPKYALYAVIGVICWQYIPFYMVYFLAAYSGLSYEIYEASIIDGASRNQYFWRIALPMMKGSIQNAAILSMVGSLKYFDLIYVMTGGGPGNASELMATYMYKNAFVTFKMGYGSTVAGGMFILITTISLITMKLLRGKEGV